MLNTIIIQDEEIKQDWTYPCLVKSMDHGSIILAIGPTEESSFSGIILNPVNTRYKSGYYSTKWAKCCFKLFEGTITLSND